MSHSSPSVLAQWQLAQDREATARFPGLFEHKLQRMSRSPLSYLRGAAPLFYRLLAEHPELGEGPAGEGWICGDAHIENFGAFRAESGKARSKRGKPYDVVFDVNDFDEAVLGPWRIDVLRLVTSLVVSGRELGADRVRVIELSYDLLDHYARHAFEDRRLPPAPPPVAALLERVRWRSHRSLLANRTVVSGGARRFVRGPRYRDLSRKLETAAREAFADYAQRLETDAPADSFEVLDAAFRVAGTGSLGHLRVAILTRGKGGLDGARLFDMKEEGPPSIATWLRQPAMDPAKRVLTALTSCLQRRPRMIGTAELDGASMFVRRLAPQEDKLALQSVRDEHLQDLARYLGALLGRAHRRGAAKRPKAPWSKDECSEVIERAAVMAGLHEAAYLAMSRRRT